MTFAELACASNFSFLRGASQASDLVARALALGYSGLGLADRNTVAGVVRAHAALRIAREDIEKQGEKPPAFHLAVGTRFVFADGTPDIVAYAQNRAGWGELCRILTVGNLRAEKGDCILHRDDLTHARHLLMILMPGEAGATEAALKDFSVSMQGSLWLGATMHRRGGDRRRLAGLKALADKYRVPLIATNDALYHAPEQRPLQDIITCIREGLKIDTAGRLLEVNAERHLKPPDEMQRLFRDAPDAIEETQHLLARAEFSLSELRYDYPDEPVPPGRTPQTYLEEMTWRRADLRYPHGIPPKVSRLLRAELKLIAELDYARYFLTIHDIVRFADDKGILCQGRGSAANSVVCFILGITNVDPEQIDVLFARFIAKERKEPPDIDVDFEHERREEVIQHIYERYGRERAGIAATVISYRPRSAIREVGKVFGLSEDITSSLASVVWGSWGDSIPEKQVRQAGHAPDNPVIARAVHFAGELLGFPRHLSQHVGGFILTRGRLDETVPIGKGAMKDRTFIEWDRDDIEELGLLKVDVLGLGMLTCIRKAFDLLRAHTDEDHTLASVPREDPIVYDMLCRGDSVGVFQVESRAQMNMLPRLRPREFYDLVIQVAIVRPGPIQGDMVHPYLRRRAGKENVEYPSPKPPYPHDELFQVLGKTKGVPLFQEQAMRLAIVAAEFSDDEANQLRRAMATFRNVGTLPTFRDKMINGMVRRGYERDFAERCFKQIEGFGSYGFPESHAAAFAHLVYISSWIKCHYPAVFACALLNAQPMGFYAPAQIVRDAREHGVEVRGADVNASRKDNTIEGKILGASAPLPPANAVSGGEGSGVGGSFFRSQTQLPPPCPSPPLAFGSRGEGTLESRAPHLALRIGFRQIDGFRDQWAETIESKRGAGFPDIETFARRTALPKSALEILANADAFRSLGLDRRQALWDVRRLPDTAPLPLFAHADAAELADEPSSHLPAMALAEHVVTDYQTLRLSLKAHPMQFLRADYRRAGIASCTDLAGMRHGDRVKIAGVVLVRQRPGQGNVVFMTLEDEGGIANIVVWSRLFEQFRREVMGSRLIEVQGNIQRSQEKDMAVIHVVAKRLIDRTADLRRLTEVAKPQFELTRADEILHPQHPRTSRHPRNVRIIPKSRDFH